MALIDALTTIAPAPAPVPKELQAEPWERPLSNNRCWPATRLASWSLTLLLAAGMYVPAVVGQAHGIQWLLLAPVLVTTMSARALFEALGFVRDTRSLPEHLAAAIPPALLAGAVMVAAEGIVGPPSSPLIGIATVALSTAALATASVLRGIEIRLMRGLRRVYFVGSPQALHDLRRELTHHADRQLVGAMTLAGGADSSNVMSLEADAVAARATVLVFDVDAISRAAVANATQTLVLDGLRLRDLVSYYEQEFKKVPLCELTSTRFAADGAPRHPSRAYARSRRVAEATVAAMLLVAAAPLVLLAAAVIRSTSPGPALYRQRRVGEGGVPFTLMKLRTMTTGPDDTPAWGSTQAHRVTWVGRHLRRSRVDELPQLWNVLRGDLALIGPRPEQVGIVERLERELPHYGARHFIRPGITGWAQVTIGYGGSIEGSLAKLQRDLYYVKHCSLRLDVLIGWLTLKTVFAGRG